MIPEPMFNPADYDIRRPLYDKAKIREHNAQRYEMEVLDGVLCYDREKEIIGGFYRLEEDSWWARGHFPDRPMLPGVLALEATGQLCSIYFHEHSAGLRMGIAKIGEVRYLRPMLPPNVLYLGARLVQKKLKFAQFAFQGIIDGKVAFFGDFTGGAV